MINLQTGMVIPVQRPAYEQQVKATPEQQESANKFLSATKERILANKERENAAGNNSHAPESLALKLKMTNELRDRKGLVPLSEIKTAPKPLSKITQAPKATPTVKEKKAQILKDIVGKPKKFVPTPELGRVTGKQLEELKKHAPEVLLAPARKSFGSEESYNEAVRKFKKNGNWASK